MRRATLLALKHLLLGCGFVLTLSAFALIAAAFLYLSLGVNKQLLEKYLSGQMQRPVQIESIETGWDGLLAEMKATGIHVQHEDGTQSTLRLRELQVSVDPIYLLGGKFKVEKTTVRGLTLEVTRHNDGTIQIGDLVFAEQDISEFSPLDWLRGQGDAEIREGQIIWRDQRDADHPITVTEFNLATRSDKTGIRFTGRASPPTELGNQIYFNGVIRDPPARRGAWDGDVNMSLSQVSIDRLPLAVRELLPWQTGGLAEVRLKTRWQAGDMTYANANVELSRFIVPLDNGEETVAVQNFISELTWRGYPDSWNLSFKDTRVVVNGRWFRTKRVNIESAQNKYVFSAAGVQIHEALNVLAQTPLELPWQDLLYQSRAYGELRNVSVTTEGPFLHPQRWRISSEFANVSWSPVGAVPGVTGGSGSVLIEPGAGRIKVDSNDLQLSSPTTLTQPLFFSHFAGLIAWQQNDDGWLLNISDVRLDDSSLRRGRGHVNLHLFDDGQPPLVDGVFSAEMMQAGRFWRYLPRGVVPDKTINWFKNALVAGSLIDLNASLAGSLKQFPLPPGQGLFSLTAEIVGGRLHYEDGWPDIQEITGTLSINNVGLRGEIASARLSRSSITQGLVTSPDVFGKRKELSIDADLTAPVEDIVLFLTQGPLLKQKSTLDIAASGEGKLDLSLFLPLSELEDRLEVAGRYVTTDASLTIQDHFALSELSGAIEFTDTTVQSDGVTGRFMGGPTTIKIETIKPGRPPVWTVRGEGHVDSAPLLSLLRSRVIADNVGGSSSWTGSLTAEPGQATLRFESDLDGIEITLPPPLAKRGNERRQSSLTATFEREQRDIRFQTKPLVGWLDYEKHDDGLKLKRGVMALGKEEVSLPSGQGVQIIVAQPSIDADRWLAAFTAGGAPADGSGASDGLLVNRFDLEIEKLRLFARDWSEITAKASSSNGRDWNAWVSAQDVLGEANLSFRLDDQPNRYVLNFQHLHVPKRVQQRDQHSAPNGPEHYPELSIRADQFSYGDWELGKLVFEADHDRGQWRINRLHLDQPGLNIEADGRLAGSSTGPITHMRADVRSDDVAVALARLRLPPHMAEADVDLKLDLNWHGDPPSFMLHKLNGGFDLTATEGLFLSVEPGSGKLLGLFNIDAVSRRFSLDFSDIFSKGLAFDQIKGQGSISAGNLYTEGLFLVGPSVAVEIDGRTGLASEDYDLEVILVPQLGSHISMLSALANPIAGAMVFIAQKVMKKTFNKLLAEVAHYRYQIQGSWEDPVITAVLMEPATEEERMR